MGVTFLALAVGGNSNSKLVYFHSHNDDRILLQILGIIFITVLVLSANNMFALKYQLPSVASNMDLVQIYAAFVVSGLILMWYSFFLFATWFGRGFVVDREDPAEVAQPCVTRCQRMASAGTVITLPNDDDGLCLNIGQLDFL